MTRLVSAVKLAAGMARKSMPRTILSGCRQRGVGVRVDRANHRARAVRSRYACTRVAGRLFHAGLSGLNAGEICLILSNLEKMPARILDGAERLLTALHDRVTANPNGAKPSPRSDAGDDRQNGGSMRSFFSVIGGFALLATANPSLGQCLAGNAERGGQIAKRWGSICQVVSVRQERATADAPTFRSIAERSPNARRRRSMRVRPSLLTRMRACPI
jgi:hypothetical protein